MKGISRAERDTVRLESCFEAVEVNILLGVIYVSMVREIQRISSPDPGNMTYPLA